MTPRQPRGHVALATSIAGLVVAVGVVAASVAGFGGFVKPLFAVLTLSAVFAELSAAHHGQRQTISAAFTAGVLAVGFLGAAPAFAIGALSFGAVWVVERYRWRALLINIAGSSTPTCLVAIAFAAIGPEPKSVAFPLLLAAAAAVTMALNFLIAPPLFGLLDGDSMWHSLRQMRAFVVPVAINIAVVAAF